MVIEGVLEGSSRGTVPTSGTTGTSSVEVVSVSVVVSSVVAGSVVG
jgi:hypothetical protein